MEQLYAVALQLRHHAPCTPVALAQWLKALRVAERAVHLTAQVVTPGIGGIETQVQAINSSQVAHQCPPIAAQARSVAHNTLRIQPYRDIILNTQFSFISEETEINGITEKKYYVAGSIFSVFPFISDYSVCIFILILNSQHAKVAILNEN